MKIDFQEDKPAIDFKPVDFQAETAPKTTTAQDTPEWAGRYPNVYGLYGAGRELLRTGIETAGTTAGQAAGALVPFPGAAYVGGGLGFAASKRAAQWLLGEDISMSPESIGKDVAMGSLQVGIGKVAGMIPGVKRIFSPSAAAIEVPSAGSGLLDKTASSMMEKSLKVPPSVKQNLRGRAIETTFKENIPVTKSGLNRAKGIMDYLEGQMDAAIAKNPDAPIQTDSLMGPVTELRQMAMNTVDGARFAKQIDKLVDRFKKQYGDTITVAQAQEIKQNTNAWLKKSYGELKPVHVEATKQIVRGLRERIAQEIPEIAGVNARYGDLANLEKVLERAVNRTGNWDWVGLIPSIGAAAVGGTTGKVSSAMEAAAVLRIIRSPAVQSHLALALKKAGAKGEVNAMANAVANTIYHKMTTGQEDQ